MRYRSHPLKKIGQGLLRRLNQAIPKAERVLVVGFPNVESSAVATANYIVTHYPRLPVSYAISGALKDHPATLLLPGVKLLPRTGGALQQLRFLYSLLRSKYLFLTHGIFLTQFSKKQVVTNIWHGILYKKIGVMIGARPMPADVSVGTSPLTVKMFAEAFGVPEDSVLICGYPRNDLLLQGKKLREEVRAKVGEPYQPGQKLLIWLPTFRKNAYREGWEDGAEAGNPFYVPGFDVQQFNNLLKAQNSFCLVKPHPMAVQYKDQPELSHVLFIDDAWISDHGLTLYHLVGATDLLISDVSSVVIDYLLLDQPIVCVSSDLEAYQQSRGFYFEDIENWLPGPVLSSQEVFFPYLETLLEEGDDGCSARRTALKSRFFSHHDDQSTARLVQHVFKLQK